MTVAEFEGADAKEFDGVLLALWWADKGDWERAHEIAQEIDGVDGSWVHAYLHRVEGDAFNSGYWYRRAGRPVARGELRAEWEGIVVEMLGRQGHGS